jgi:predicted ferric reductase
MGRPTPIYRGLPRPVRLAGWIALAIVVGAVAGATAPTALRRIGAVAALQPGLLDWYIVRALGFLAYGVLTASVLYGLLLSTKILDAVAHRPVSFALHKELAIAGLGLAGLHAALLIGDQSFKFTPTAIMVPFASPYAPAQVGIGQLTFYLTAVITATFYVRRQIGQNAWRLIHYMTFLSFAGATVHGLASGSDSDSSWAFWVYLTPTVMTIFLLTYRIVVSLAVRLHYAREGAAPTPGVGEPLGQPRSRGPA